MGDGGEEERVLYGREDEMKRKGRRRKREGCEKEEERWKEREGGVEKKTEYYMGGRMR